MTLIKREDALKPFCTAPDGTRIPEVDCDNFPVAFSVEFIKKHLLSLPLAESHNKDAISREGLLKSWEELSPRGRLEFDQVIMTIPALPSAEAVSREECIDAITKCRERKNKEIEELRELYSDSKADWIPCSERLPKHGDDILVTYSDGEVSIIRGARSKNWMKWGARENSNLILPIAWMPLPKPYREDGEA